VPDAFVTGYLLDYKPAPESTWTQLPEVRGTSVDLPDLAPGIYNFRLRAINSVAVKSAYSATTTKEMLGLTAAPADISNFSVIKVGGVAVATWQLSGDLDVRLGGRVVVRHSPQVTGATWQDGYILEEFNGDAVTGLLPLISGTYMAKARDSSGRFSANGVYFVVTEGMTIGFTTVASSVQDPTFGGAKTNTTVVSGALQLANASLVSGSYEFTTHLDMLSVATRRVEAVIKTLSIDTNALIDNKTALIDTWDDFDGVVVNDCDATLYYSATNDNPSGSPVWGPWTPFFVADITSRAIRFRLDLISADSTHNIAVSTLRVDVKTPI
jgi:hypothetical protein